MRFKTPYVFFLTSVSTYILRATFDGLNYEAYMQVSPYRTRWYSCDTTTFKYASLRAVLIPCTTLAVLLYGIKEPPHE